METLNALQSVQAIYVKGLCMRIHPNTRTRLEENFSKEDLKGVLVEYWGNWYIRVDKITPEIGYELTRCTMPTDSKE